MKSMKYLAMALLSSAFVLASCQTERTPTATSTSKSSRSSSSKSSKSSKESSESLSEISLSNDDGDESVSSSSSEATPTVPTTGFYIVVNGASYHELTGGEPWDMDPTFHQYQCLNVTLALNDVISFYDADNAAGWSEMAIDPASVGSFTQGESGIVCGEAGTFDMYVKLKYGADNIYFGYHA